MLLNLVKKLIGTAQSRLLTRYSRLVKEVNRWEERYQALSEEEMKAKTAEFKERLTKGESVDALLPEAYAAVKNACRRLMGSDVHVSGYEQKWDMIPYDVQILGAIAMHYGAIAEMQTGEGKTLTASLPLYLHALTGKAVHLVTVNDYLAQRDCEWVGAIFRWLGLSVSALTGATPPHQRHETYKADIVYGTASEFGFDYLRDNSMAQSAQEQCQRGHYFAIVDEVDSILIDEARTPLIISGPAPNSMQMYSELKDPVAELVKHQKELCNRLATEARHTLEELGQTQEEGKKAVTKEQRKELDEAFRKLWLVLKGMPQNRILKKLKEDPDLRAELDRLDTYFYGEPNKEERLERLSYLYIVVEERQSEYELTDKGIDAWKDAVGSQEDFVMLDLGGEYAKIDSDTTLSDDGKMKRKVALREEDARRKERAHNLRQLLRAHLLMERDVDYIVQDDKIVLIDENTGRPQPGRRFSDGLHQAIEAKEGVSIQRETQTYATVTLQNYFRMYARLAGMTGTAMTEANEFKEIYKLEVVAIPTYRECVRKDADDEIYMTEREKLSAIVRDVTELYNAGRPILIVTDSVEASEKLARILRQNKITHTVLNAKQHEHEAEIIADAGQRAAITVATNMAGRGTDIKLKPGVKELGGLHVIGTTRHQSRRIDRQGRGRCARLGDPGSSKFYISFEDPLLRLFTSPKITQLLQRFRPPEGEPISGRILTRAVETAQKRVEQRNYTIRKHTLEYDDVMNRQRKEIYAFRNELLHTQEPVKCAEEIVETVITQKAEECFRSREEPGGWDVTRYCDWLMEHFPLTFDYAEFDDDYAKPQELAERAITKVKGLLQMKLGVEAEQIERFQPTGTTLPATSLIQEVVRSVQLHHLDRLWQEHLLRLDHLRAEVHLRTIGQKDPLLEFKEEAFRLFEMLSTNIKLEIAHALFKFGIVPQQQPAQPKRREFIHRTDLSLIGETNS